MQRSKCRNYGLGFQTRLAPVSRSLLRLILMGLVFFLLTGESTGAEPNVGQWSKRFGTQPLQLESGDWQATIGRLAAALQTPMITFIPMEWRPRELKGTPAEILQVMEVTTRGKWSALRDALGLFPARVDKGMDFDEAEIKAFKVRDRYAAQVAYSLIPAQLSILGKGDKIPIAHLREEQQALLRNHFEKHVVDGATLWPVYLKKGELGLRLVAWTSFYWRGTGLDMLQQVPRSEWKEFIFWKERHNKNSKPASPSPSLAERFFGKESLTFMETRRLELGQLEELLNPLLRNRCPNYEFCVSARVRKQAYVITKGPPYRRAESWNCGLWLMSCSSPFQRKSSI
jgi:hypothetical protein